MQPIWHLEDFNMASIEQTKKETIPYPICSVVAAFKMLIRILNTLRSRIWDMVWFLFSVFWLQKEWMQWFLGEIRRRGQQSSPCSEDISVMEFYLSALHYICYSLFFLFSSVSSKEWNSKTSWQMKEKGYNSKAKLFNVKTYQQFNQLNLLLQMIVSSNCCSNRTHRKCLLTSPKSWVLNF